MQIRPSVAIALCLAMPALAHAAPEAVPEPAYVYRVVDVPRADTLTMRAQPDAQAAAVGVLASDADRLHVAGTQVDTEEAVWWQVLDGDRTGWVPARHLSRVDPSAMPESDYPLRCSGTEPFWSLTLREGRASFETPDVGPQRWVSGPLTPAHGAWGRYAVRLEAEGTPGYVTVSRQADFCSDGMSDIGYPFEGIVITPDGQVYAGCCARAGG